jgi:hypothetical protein
MKTKSIIIQIVLITMACAPFPHKGILLSNNYKSIDLAAKFMSIYISRYVSFQSLDKNSQIADGGYLSKQQFDSIPAELAKSILANSSLESVQIALENTKKDTSITIQSISGNDREFIIPMLTSNPDIVISFDSLAIYHKKILSGPGFKKNLGIYGYFIIWDANKRKLIGTGRLNNDIYENIFNRIDNNEESIIANLINDEIIEGTEAIIKDSPFAKH